jgi:predicted transcriptional regulator
MTRRQSVSKAELEVARIVWRLGGATVRQVLEALPTERRIEYKTVQTYLRRLEAKGYLRGKRQGRSTFYTVRVRADRVIRETVRDFVNRLFDGDALPLFEHIISEQGLSSDDIRQLREMLDRKEAEQHEHHD